MEKTQNVYTVSQVNSYIKGKFACDALLNNICVKGEVISCKYHNSGHIYFTIQDTVSQLSVVMFKGNTFRGLKFKLENGQQVVVNGKVNIYEKDGKLQLYAVEIKKFGNGDLYEKYLALKEGLEKEGLFSQAHKKNIPLYPKKIGIVTAKDGAAIEDIINIATRRNPYIQLYLRPVQVQGNGAEKSIVQGLRYLDDKGMDVIIVGRGGGAQEDLWCFNDETLARTVYAMKTPVISAVGHEVDFTIIDFVADLRAPTPSAAAELACPEISKIDEDLFRYGDILRKLMNEEIKRCQERIEGYALQLNYLSPKTKIAMKKGILAEKLQRLKNAAALDSRIKSMRAALETKETVLRNGMKSALDSSREKVRAYAVKMTYLGPRSKIDMLKKTLAEKEQRLKHAASIGARINGARSTLISKEAALKTVMDKKLSDRINTLKLLAAGLDSKSPAKRIMAGYAYVDKSDGEGISSVDEISKGDNIGITIKDGTISAVVIDKKKKKIQ